MSASTYLETNSSLWLPRLGARLAAVGASAGLIAGLAELALGAHIRSWVGNKQDTTRLGVATITLSAIALLAALTWLRRRDASPGKRLLIVIGLIVPGVICFTTVGRAWYLPGGLLVVAAAMAAAELREDAREVVDTISRRWLAALTVVLGAFFIFLGVTALGVPGTLGIVGGITIIAVIATSSRVPSGVGSFVLVAAALPFAVLTWWSIVTPLLAIATIAIGWRALRGGWMPRELSSVE